MVKTIDWDNREHERNKEELKEMVDIAKGLEDNKFDINLIKEEKINGINTILSIVFQTDNLEEVVKVKEELKRLELI